MNRGLIKNVLWIAALLIIISTNAYSQAAGDPDGIWIYSCPDAPSEYQTGKMLFKKENGNLKVVFPADAPGAEAITVIKKNDTYSWTFRLDGYDIGITLKQNGDRLAGSVYADNWEMPISMSRQKK
jgi:hypothetical protein